MDVQREYEYGRMKITQTNDGEWWLLFLADDMGKWIPSTFAPELSGLLHGEHLHSFERFHATSEERDMIVYWRQHAT